MFLMPLRSSIRGLTRGKLYPHVAAYSLTTAPTIVAPLASIAAPAMVAGPNSPTVYTTRLEVAKQYTVIPAYRVLDNDGRVLDAGQEPQIPRSLILKMYRDMVTLSVMDLVLYEAQRQGRISFYITSQGEEATHIGSAAALKAEDVVLGQYRETGVLLFRGFTLDEFMNQCYGTILDEGKGRQMPVHYSSRKLNFQTISSPLGTQIPQAAGVGYALKMQGDDRIAICYFGEGAASEGDFHAGLNIAATTGSPAIFFCRNNGYAISTSVGEQYRGDGIASRGPGYGIPTLRVDGNDVLAVYVATKMAREIAYRDKMPVLIEAMTYRVGHHSTSDDSTAYRTKAEIDSWIASNNPIHRFQRYLTAKAWWSIKEDAAFREQVRKDVLKAFADAENKPKPAIKAMFTDVYAEMPWNLREQQRQLDRLIREYPEEYSTKGFVK